MADPISIQFFNFCERTSFNKCGNLTGSTVNIGVNTFSQQPGDVLQAGGGQQNMVMDSNVVSDFLNGTNWMSLGWHNSSTGYQFGVKIYVPVQVLGIGANGHLGFNEPGSALASRTRVKRLSDRTRRDNARFFTGLDDVPTHCVTQGLGTILAARRLVLVATGDTKADAVAAALEGPLTASVPASVLQWHADTVVCLDEAAAAGLRNRQYYDDAASGLTG